MQLDLPWVGHVAAGQVVRGRWSLSKQKNLEMQENVFTRTTVNNNIKAYLYFAKVDYICWLMWY